MTKQAVPDDNKNDSKDTVKNSKSSSSKQQAADNDEERIRERLKQKKEMRRASSNPEVKDAASPAHKKRRRHGHHRGSRRRRRHDHRDAGAAPPPRHDRRHGGGPSPPEWRGRGPPPPPRYYDRDRAAGGWRGGGGRGGPPPDVWRGRGPPPPPHSYGRHGDVGGPGPGVGPPRYNQAREGGDRGRHADRRRRHGRRQDRSVSRSRSYSRSSSRSRSSRSRSFSSRSSKSTRSSRSPSSSSSSRSSRRTTSSRSRRSRSYSNASSFASSSSSSSSSLSESEAPQETDELTKDQRTVLVSQLVMRTTERDVSKFFRKTLKLKVKEVILLRDRRTNRHKGIAYVELAKLEHVPTAVQASGVAPDFQRFPILIKASEAEKNYNAAGACTTLVPAGPMVDPTTGQLYEAQRVYVGNLDPAITALQLQAVFIEFGTLHKVALQVEPLTGVSKGFVFLSFADPKSANLAIQAMAGQVWAGRAIKTGWANHTSSVPSVEMRTSDAFPDDAAARIQKAQLALAQVQASAAVGGPANAVMTTSVASAVPAAATVSSVAEAAINAALGLPPNANTAATATPATVLPAPTTPATAVASVLPAAATPAVMSTTTPTTKSDNAKTILGTPSVHLLVRNMFDKDEETEQGWEEEIRLDFLDECQKYGTLERVHVMSTEPGGKIYASFHTLVGAQNCAVSLAGRWFDKRQLQVEYVQQDDLPKHVKNKILLEKEKDSVEKEVKTENDSTETGVKKEGHAASSENDTKKDDSPDSKTEEDGTPVIKKGEDDTPDKEVKTKEEVKTEDVKKEEE